MLSQSVNATIRLFNGKLPTPCLSRRFLLANVPSGRTSSLFFEIDGRVCPSEHSRASGNPVKIGDGYATVTGYKLPKPLVPPSGIGKAGARFKPRVRISVWLCSSRSPQRDQLLRQEKDEAS